MVVIGKTNHLQIVKEVDFGLYLEGGDLGEILLPARYIPPEISVGDWIDVFVYLDSEDIVIATTEKPYAEIGECAHLKVVDQNEFGAFLDWGLAKDLFVPFREQRVPMETGKSYTICIFEDNTRRICASSKLSHFLKETAGGEFAPGQAVELLIAARSQLGFKAVINGTHLGLIHNADVLAPIRVGQKMKGYIKKVRADDAIDLMLQQQGAEMRDDLYQNILNDLKAQGGVSTVTDKSPPEEIFRLYQVSKANYKKVIGQLYREKRILIEKDKITLIVDS